MKMDLTYDPGQDRIRLCLRTGDEIAAWSSMNDDNRLRLMESVLPQRAQRRESA